MCNVAEQTCDRPGLASLPWLRKLPALQEVPAELEKPVSRLARPDRNACDPHTSCPRDTTCCFMEESRRWGCCPLPNVSHTDLTPCSWALAEPPALVYVTVCVCVFFSWSRRRFVAKTESTAAPSLSPATLRRGSAPRAPWSSPGSPRWRPPPRRPVPPT